MNRFARAAICTGVFFCSSFDGLGTKLKNNGSYVMIDWNGSPDTGVDNIDGQTLAVAVIYNASGSYSYTQIRQQSTSTGGVAGTGFMIGSRGSSSDRYFHGYISEILVVCLLSVSRGELHCCFNLCVFVCVCVCVCLCVFRFTHER